MVDDTHARLRRARIDAGYNSAQAACDAFGWNAAAYRHHENGTREFDFATAQRYGKAFKQDAAWLMGEGGASKKVAGRAQPEVSLSNQNDDSDAVEVQEWDIAYGMGGGTYLDLPVNGTKHKFSRSLLRHFTKAPPEKIFIASGSGDSMMPTILDADFVVIDTSDRALRMGDKIYAAAYGQTGLIKRLRPMPDGSIKILSDNQSVPPEIAYDGELSVVGKVVAIIRKP